MGTLKTVIYNGRLKKKSDLVKLHFNPGVCNMVNNAHKIQTNKYIANQLQVLFLSHIPIPLWVASAEKKKLNLFIFKFI